MWASLCAVIITRIGHNGASPARELNRGAEGEGARVASARVVIRSAEPLEAPRAALRVAEQGLAQAREP
jgi:hypothetical protein